MIIKIPLLLIYILGILGFVTSSYLTYFLYRNIVSYLKNKEPYRSNIEYKYLLLKDQNDLLREKITTLEEENQKILDAIILHIKER